MLFLSLGETLKRMHLVEVSPTSAGLCFLVWEHGIAPHLVGEAGHVKPLMNYAFEKVVVLGAPSPVLVAEPIDGFVLS